MSKDRVVVITGGGSGMGKAIAYRFAEAGDRVYILGRRKAVLEETARKYKNIEAIVTDVTKPSSIEAAKQGILAEHKTVDVLINCAGGVTKVDPQATFEEAVKGWDSIITTNLTGTFNTIFSFGPCLTRPGGRIINITSTAALGGSSSGGVGGQAYSAAKSGVHGFTRTLVHMFSPEGITVNCLAPGVIDNTEFFGGDGVPEDRKENYLAKIPVDRLGSPDEIAAGAYYLASKEAGFITGEILNINGGMQFGR